MDSESQTLDVAPPRAWRRLVPAWLRALVWLDSANQYDGFLSYSWKADSAVAPVIQSVLHDFLRPWYRPRALNIFRDLSCLPAGSSLEAELYHRLDRSQHLIVLASPEAARSQGMEKEAAHWFSKPRKGQVLVIVTAGTPRTWQAIREQLLPPSLRTALVAEPLFVSIQHRRAEIVESPRRVREKLIGDLKQLILRFHPGRDWGQLGGEERRHRRNALRLVVAVLLAFAGLTSWGILQRQRAARGETTAASNARDAETAKLSLSTESAVAESRELARQAMDARSTDAVGSLRAGKNLAEARARSCASEGGWRAREVSNLRPSA